MAYMRSNIISRPASHDLGLGDVMDTIKGGASAVLDFFGSGLKAQGAQEALAAQMKADAEARARAASGGGVPTTYLLVGGAVLAGALVLALRRK